MATKARTSIVLLFSIAVSTTTKCCCYAMFYNRKVGIPDCGVWVAPSTLPGAGIGMFAGRNFSQAESILPMAGDLVIPIPEQKLYHGEMKFLWDEYTWNADAVQCSHESQHSDILAASPGFGAAANSFLDFVNVHEGVPIVTTDAHLHRSVNPGAGAYTAYHSRMGTASQDIIAGQELFVDYGHSWFIDRQAAIGAIPIYGDHDQAEQLYRKFDDKLFQKYNHDNNKSNNKNNNSDKMKLVLEDLWNQFILNGKWTEKRIVNAFPSQFQEYQEMLDVGLVKYKKSRMTKPVEWLQEHGVCADYIYQSQSTLPFAGRGAFASQYLPKGTLVAPVPLIHLPFRNVTEMYHTFPQNLNPNEKLTVVGHQLLLNYCMGHRDSTLLLSPYGPVFNFVNHNQTLANVKLQWASPTRSSHNPTLLTYSVQELYDNVYGSSLAMELVALRDIEPHEEIFLDYGDEWEQAWQYHLQAWQPVPYADSYISANEFYNNLVATKQRLLTEFEQIENPYPSNIDIQCDLAFKDENGWREAYENGRIKEFQKEKDDWTLSCEILRVREFDQLYYYTVVIIKDNLLLEDIPFEAFRIVDRPRTTDMFLANAFRHDLRVPDELFPEAWKNLKH